MDRSLVGGANEVAITKVNLYFRAKPPATGNKSGINNPGVEVLILPTKSGLPVINQIGAYRPTEPTEHGAKFAFYSGGQVSRVEYSEIIASADASVPTEFLLSSPAFVRTDQEYAIVVKFDGNENFVLWQARTGDWLVGTTKACPGPSGRFTGNLFGFISNPNSGSNNSGYGYTSTAVANSTANNSALMYTSTQSLGIDIWDNNYLAGSWSPIPNADLKYGISVARYAHKGFPVVANSSIVGNNLLTSASDRTFVFNTQDGVLSNNIVRLIAPVEVQEYVLFERENSVRNELFYGETVFQYAPSFPGGYANPLKVTCSPTSNIQGLVNISGVSNLTEFQSKLVIANGSFVLANGKSFSNGGGFRNIITQGSSIVFTSANGSDHELRYVEEIIANNIVLMDAPFGKTLTNATMSFAPSGYINDISPSFIYGRNQDILTLYDSTANASIRFVSFAVANVSISANGGGYANSDYLRIRGFENVANVVWGNYAAFANIVTNNTGNIVGVYMSNLGSGFVNTSWLTGTNVQILTSANNVASNSSSSGTGATFNIDIGSKLYSEFSESMFANAQIINLDAIRMKPEITVNNPVGTAFTIKHRTLYYKTPNSDTESGWGYFVNTPAEQAATDTYAKIFKGHSLITNDNRIPVIPSRSNQFTIRYANGTSANSDIIGEVYSNAAAFVFEISSNNDYQACYFDPEIVNSHYANYIINAEYTDEHTNYGKAWAKHLTTKINFKEDRVAEDLLVYLTAYKPLGSDIKVYAKIHNSKDTEEFDDKDWTLLDLIDGLDVYSSKDDSSDFKEYTYNLPSFPNSELTLIGSATILKGNATVTGTNTQFAAQFNIASGGTGYSNGDIAIATPPEDSPPISGIYSLDSTSVATGLVTTNSTGGISAISVIDTGMGFLDQANISGVSFTNSTGGSTGGSTANVLYRPGIAANDVVKIYSPYFPETNYTVVVIDTVANDTSFTIKRTFGDLQANGIGTVTVNTTSTTVVGSGTSFTTDFSAGDFLAVWANTTAYEVRQIESVTNTSQLSIIAGNNFTFAGGSKNYAYVETDAFTNSSITVSDLKIDKVHYEHQVFNNIQNDNVARYYATNKSVFDGYDTFQIKIVMVSNSEIHVPKIDDTKGIGVSA